MSTRPRLLIVYHSQTGTTERMAEHVIAGARSGAGDDVEVRVRDALEADVDDVLGAAGIILGTPENFGYMSGAMKYFFDRIYYPCLDHTAGRPYALFVRAGNDGTGAVSSIERIVTGLRWRLIADPVLAAGEFDPGCLADCTELGTAFAAGLEAGIF